MAIELTFPEHVRRRCKHKGHKRKQPKGWEARDIEACACDLAGRLQDLRRKESVEETFEPTTLLQDRCTQLQSIVSETAMEHSIESAAGRPLRSDLNAKLKDNINKRKRLREAGG